MRTIEVIEMILVQEDPEQDPEWIEGHTVTLVAESVTAFKAMDGHTMVHLSGGGRFVVKPNYAQVKAFVEGL